MGYTQTGGSTNSFGVQSIISRESLKAWRHYAWVYTGSRLLIYIDGILVSQTERQNLTMNTSNDNFRISMSDNNYIDELRISSVARSGDELKAYVDFVRPLLD